MFTLNGCLTVKKKICLAGFIKIPNSDRKIGNSGPFAGDLLRLQFIIGASCSIQTRFLRPRLCLARGARQLEIGGICAWIQNASFVNEGVKQHTFSVYG